MSKVLLGHMYLAKNLKCGGVIGFSWKDKGRKKEDAKTIRKWLKRGLAVELLVRYEGDPEPKICTRNFKVPCACQEVDRG
ncbi:hypothetical protein DTO96_102546 [Ephemeroptericola cinctiostellae]|uniref:Uncharacterized protein n=1 Tax=Ephemeroptericola cinctiostellae TaxID=2268024 RepID=A0A345DEK2_9BURK|nr:hypothetical protein [Ephemeroptericola cinctiostellae]AXF86790.1 hypothetical protein DTO96_102546 [Ephemeroptericola cinctiostellae]